jgi:cystathionine beta-lyase
MYDFSKKINRKNSNSYKWDSVDATLPMWVEDMDFEACPDIIDAIKKRMECPVFGYSITPK